MQQGLLGFSLGLIFCFVTHVTTCPAYTIGKHVKNNPTYVIERLNVNDSGSISVTYTDNGERWASDYMTPEDFYNKFGINITNYKD